MARTDWLMADIVWVGRLLGAPGPFEGNLITARRPSAGNMQPAQYRETSPIPEQGPGPWPILTEFNV